MWNEEDIKFFNPSFHLPLLRGYLCYKLSLQSDRSRVSRLIWFCKSLCFLINIFVSSIIVYVLEWILCFLNKNKLSMYKYLFNVCFLDPIFHIWRVINEFDRLICSFLVYFMALMRMIKLLIKFLSFQKHTHSCIALFFYWFFFLRFSPSFWPYFFFSSFCFVTHWVSLILESHAN